MFERTKKEIYNIIELNIKSVQMQSYGCLAEIRVIFEMNVWETFSMSIMHYKHNYNYSTV